MPLLKIDLRRLVQALVRYHNYLLDREDIIHQCTSHTMFNGIDDIHTRSLRIDKAVILLADSHKQVNHDEIIAKHYKANIGQFTASEQHMIKYYFKNYLEVFEVTLCSQQGINDTIAKVFKNICIEVPERPQDDDLAIDNSTLIKEIKTKTLEELQAIELDELDSNIQRRVNNRITFLKKEHEKILRKKDVERLKQSHEYLLLEQAYKGLDVKLKRFCDEYVYNLYIGRDEVACELAYYTIFDEIDQDKAKALLSDEVVAKGIAFNKQQYNNAEYVRAGKWLYQELAPSLIC